MNGYLTIRELADKWNLTVRRVQKMCADGDIPGAIKFGNAWAIPDNIDKPKDKRVKSGKYINQEKNN